MAEGSNTANGRRRAPDLAAGQVWRPSKAGSRSKHRVIVWAGTCPPSPSLRWIDYPSVGYVHEPTRPAFPETGHDSWVGEQQFRRWIRKHEAVLVVLP